eukprot:UN11692
MALSASIANDNNNEQVEQKVTRAKNENVELEFEMTDHKPKIKRQQQEHDFLDLMSMDISNENEQKNIILDDNDPFASLIQQYSNDDNNKVMDMNMGMEEVQFESNLFGDNLSNDKMDLMDDVKVKNHMISVK